MKNILTNATMIVLTTALLSFVSIQWLLPKESKAEVVYANEVIQEKPVEEKVVKIERKSSDLFITKSELPTSRQEFKIAVEKATPEPPPPEPKIIENPFSHLREEEVKGELNLSATDLNVLYRITEAEAGGEDDKGKRLVVLTLLNRIVSPRFPNNATDVVFAKNSRGTHQYTPISNGRYDKVTVSQNTRDAVDTAIRDFESGVDESQGSTFFMAPQLVNIDPSATSVGVKWQQDNLDFVMSHGTHEFRRYK